MSQSRECKLLLDQGRKEEKKYDWVAAVEPYKKALAASLRFDARAKAAEICERIGFCYHHAAMQAENPQDFKNRMFQAADAYIEGAELFGETEDPEKLAKTLHCQARAAYLRSCLEPDSTSRKMSLDKCWGLAEEALRLYRKTDDSLNLGRTCNELIIYLLDRLDLEWDTQKRRRMLKEALGYGEEAITILSEAGEEYELARAYCITSIHCHTAASGLELDRKMKYERKALNYSRKAVDLSEKIGDHLLLGFSNISLGSVVTPLPDHQGSAAEHFGIALRCGIHTRDNYLIGQASYALAQLMAWKMIAEENPDKIREESRECQRHSLDALHRFSLISNDQRIASSYYWHAENYNTLAQSVETSSEKKRIRLKEAIEAGRKGLEHARRSGSITATWLILHPIVKSLFFLSTTETNTDTKKQLLEESLQYSKENIQALKQAMPYYFWNQGVRMYYLALIQAELAEIEADRKLKIKLLVDATKSAENCVNLCLRPGTINREECAALGGYCFFLGGILNRLYQLTGVDEHLLKSAEVCKRAVEIYEKAELPSRVAEGNWQLANAYNKLQNYAESAKSFQSASMGYKAAAMKLPQLKAFYLNYATYMQAWNAIGNAMHSHMKEDYLQSRAYYERAADICKVLKPWSYLAPNCSAWAHLELGEDLSRKEMSGQAIQAFQQAMDLFGEAKEALKEAASKVENNDEKEQALALSKASATRREYCRGRILLEEARIHDRKGDHYSSSENYGSATKAFQKVAGSLEQESERRELYPIICSCQAWEKMKLAEQKVAPALFKEASKLFTRAKEHSIKEKTSLLAMGNSALCRALEAGTRFEATMDIKFYSAAKRNMESAANYYLRAGFEQASMWVNANESLLDAYIHMTEAETATGHGEKIREYKLAEKYLERAAELYEMAGYTGKFDEVKKALSKIREKREFALSLSEALEPPTLSSSTTLLSVLTSTHKEAAGLEMFEHANVQANLILKTKEVMVGEDISLTMELVNAGKAPALLVRVEEMIPKSFEIREVSEVCRVEDHHLNMKGKRLDPLKIEDVRMVVRPLARGRFTIKPRVFYIDETGKSKSHEPEPATVTVKELGIKGWLKGER